MYLQLGRLLPTYFEESRKETSEIWGKELRFDEGERIKIVAPSGSGKTSLMHFMYGIRKEYAGEVCYDNQRIAIIRALMQPFDFLLLDEPYSHLDEANRKKAMELIYEECGKRNAAMVFADLKPLDFFKDEKIIYL
jgi:ABC-type lipoprotein export system ATPase subunit